MSYNVCSASIENAKVAKTITSILRKNGIDVVDGLTASECLGRTPLSCFLLSSRYAKTLFVGSLKDQKISYLEKATGSDFPGRYFLCRDIGEHTLPEYAPCHIESVMLQPLEPVDSSTRFSVYYMEPSLFNEVVCGGTVSYDPWKGELSFEKTPEAREGLKPIIKDDARYGHGVNKTFQFLLPSLSGEVLSNGETGSATVFGTNETLDISEFIRRNTEFKCQTTGARIIWRYGFAIDVPTLPDPTFVDSLEERLTFKTYESMTGWNNPKFGGGTNLPCLTDEQLAEVKPLLDEMLDAPASTSRRRYGYSENSVYAQYALYVAPAPKGERRPIGHIVVGLSDGNHREYGEIAICRINARFVITDTYIRVRETVGGASAFRRCEDRTMTSLKELIGDPQIIKGTIDNAKNLKNRYAANAAVDGQTDSGSKTVSASVLKDIASLRFGGDFVEWCYRMGYQTLAQDACRAINSTRAWNRVTSMTDLIPGYVEGTKSIYTCFGLPKAWGKAVFDTCAKENPDGFGLEELGTGAVAMEIAWDLEGALTGGKQSTAAVPKRATEYASIWIKYAESFGFVTRRNENTIYRTYHNDPIGLADAIRSYHRMISKAAKLGLGGWQNERYLQETFEAYCKLKEIGEDPKALGVLYEYGLPEDDSNAASEMIRRRCEAAQAVVQSFKDRIDARARAKIEEGFAQTLTKNRYLECSDPEVSKGFVFKLPTAIYGLDNHLSIESEGSRQRNCVFNSYPRKLAEAEYTVILMRRRVDPDANYVTIGINKGGIVDQTYGYRDSQISTEAAEAIKSWMRKVNSRDKGKVSFRGNPGGWNHMVNASI